MPDIGLEGFERRVYGLLIRYLRFGCGPELEPSTMADVIGERDDRIHELLVQLMGENVEAA